jgi:hypothetical protein
MKKKIWNKASVPTQKATGYWIRVQPKSGGITFSNDLARCLQLTTNGINFVQDEDRLSDWFIELSKDENAFMVRSKKSNQWDRSFILQSTALAREILKSINSEMVSTRFIVAAEPIEENVYAIITKSAAHSKKLKAA